MLINKNELSRISNKNNYHGITNKIASFETDIEKEICDCIDNEQFIDVSIEQWDNITLKMISYRIKVFQKAASIHSLLTDLSQEV